MVDQKHQSPAFRITLRRIAICRFHLGSHKDPSSWVFKGYPSFVLYYRHVPPTLVLLSLVPTPEIWKEGLSEFAVFRPAPR